MTMTAVETTLTCGRQSTPNPARSGLPTFGVGAQLRKNPYCPGAGLRPAALVGRDDELQNWSGALKRLENARSAKSVVLHGLRGEGRTVLLGEFHRMAEGRDWISVIIEANAGSPLRETLARALYPVVRELVRPSAGEKLTKALATFKAFSVKVDIAGAWSFGLDVRAERGRGDSGELEADISELIKDLAEAAQEQRRGLAILIDEAQDLTRDELKALSEICDQGGQFRWPFLMALAGLPSLPRALSKVDGVAEHLFRHWEVTQLQDGAAWQALTGPAAGEGVSWDEDAVRYVMKESQGHPYFLQEYGQATWNAAEGATLTYDDARVGVASGRAHLDAGFYRRQWERATHAQQAYLKAMTRDGVGPSQSADVASRLGRTPMCVGAFRDSLIKKGLIYAPHQGQVAYAVPGMADFIFRQFRP
jgi:AAA ATPase domain